MCVWYDGSTGPGTDLHHSTTVGEEGPPPGVVLEHLTRKVGGQVCGVRCGRSFIYKMLYLKTILSNSNKPFNFKVHLKTLTKL